MELFITGFVFGFGATLINRRLLKKAFRHSEAVAPQQGFIIFSRINMFRIILNLFVLGAAATKGVTAAMGAFSGLFTQMLFYIYDIIILSRKG